jgi:protein-serine/threonine kinase
MEYCPGGDLYAVIKQQVLGLDVAVRDSHRVQVRDAGNDLLEVRVDLGLLDGKGHVKITDFGVSDVFRMCWEKTTHLSKGLCSRRPQLCAWRQQPALQENSPFCSNCSGAMYGSESPSCTTA